MAISHEKFVTPLGAYPIQEMLAHLKSSRRVALRWNLRLTSSLAGVAIIPYICQRNSSACQTFSRKMWFSISFPKRNSVCFWFYIPLHIQFFLNWIFFANCDVSSNRERCKDTQVTVQWFSVCCSLSESELEHLEDRGWQQRVCNLHQRWQTKLN